MDYSAIKDKRKKYNISQTKLAEASNYSKATISAWELGKSIPTDNDIICLNNVLDRFIRDIDECIFDVRKKRIQD